MYNGLVVGSKAYRGLELSSHVLRVIMDHLRSMSSRLKTNIVVYGTTASPTALHVFHRNWISYAVWPKENGGYSEEVSMSSPFTLCWHSRIIAIYLNDLELFDLRIHFVFRRL